MNAKKIIALLLTLSLLIGAMLCFTACTNPDNKKDDGDDNVVDPNDGNGNNGNDSGTEYTVTVVDIGGEPVEGVTLKFTYDDTESAPVTTDADGKASAKLDTLDDIVVEFVDLEGYGSPAKSDRKIVYGETEITVTLLQLVTVRVVNENGEAVEGVSVQICHNVCLLPSSTDFEGQVTKSMNPVGTVKVSINSVPEGYAIPEAIAEYEGIPIHAYFAEGEYTVTVTIPYAQ